VLTNLNLTEVVSNTMALLMSQAKAKNVSLIFNQKETVEILADRDQMTQVLMNLLINAIQILPNKGKIQVTLQDGMDNVALVVMDDGPGILAENQAQIFEPFFTQRAGGVGLGLAVVRQIVQVHKGDISYQTSPWGGAQFTITLPKAH
jgi:two-component system, NtrC family, sensor histidine kinase HydH